MQSPTPTHFGILLKFPIFETMSEMLIILMNAADNRMLAGAIKTVLAVLTELVANDLTYSGAFTTPCLLESIINGIVLKPKRNFGSVVYIETSAILLNLAGIDDIDFLTRLVDLGLPTAIMTLLSMFYDRSSVILMTCLDALGNLMNCYQD